MDAAIYFPIHRAKKGEIVATGHLSPHARARVRPIFDVQKQNVKDGRKIEEYFNDLAEDIVQSWGTRHALLIDFSRYEPDAVVRDGRHCIEYLFSYFRQRSMQGIPVAGPESVRGPGPAYLEAVARLAREDGRGAALRIPFEEVIDTAKLKRSIDTSLTTLQLTPKEVDLILDLESLSLARDESRTFSKLFPASVQAILIARDLKFRNIILCGSSVPESVGKKYEWNSFRASRVELEIWRELVGEVTMPLIGFGDYAITYPMEQDSGNPVNPPGRIRLSTATEHSFWRAPREDYPDLCAKVFSSSDFDPTLRAWGATTISLCARYGRNEGGPTEWVARDTNYHVELTLREIEATLRGDARFERLTFATEEQFAWGTTGDLTEAH